VCSSDLKRTPDNVQPASYWERAEPLSDRVISSGSAVLAVLEIAGGASARLGIKPGDRVRYPLFERGTAR
jgi:uncharacterized membrane protein (UPF0127 family)